MISTNSSNNTGIKFDNNGPYIYPSTSKRGVNFSMKDASFNAVITLQNTNSIKFESNNDSNTK